MEQRNRAAKKTERRQQSKVNSSHRLGQMPFAAALSSGLPLLIGAYSHFYSRTGGHALSVC